MKQLSNTSNLVEEATKRLNQAIDVKKSLETWLSGCPEGKIHVVNSKNRIQYYLRKESSDKSGNYLGKKQQKTIKTFLQKSYDEKAVKSLNKEIRILSKFIKEYSGLPAQFRNLYSELPDPMKGFINPVDISDDDFVRNWKNLDFTPKRIEENSSSYVTDRSEVVRSKSELAIANMLNKMNIPYRYECPVELRRGIIIHPDFTVLNIKTRKTFYWEHRGMMDDRDYAQNSVRRIKDYESCGIFPGKGLIITEETLRTPLGTKEIMSVIQAYLL